MADDSSKTQEQREREAREAINAAIINDPAMAAAVQSVGRSS